MWINARSPVLDPLFCVRTRRRVFGPITARPYEVISLDPNRVSSRAGSTDDDLWSSPQSRRCGRDDERRLIDRWEIIGLLRDLAARGEHPCVIAFAADEVVRWDSATVGDQALRLAHGLHDAGVGRNTRVAIWAPNSPVWVVAAIAVLAAGGVVVPIDDLADADQFEGALTSATVRLILTTAHHLEASGDMLRAHAVRVVLIDEPEGAAQLAVDWRSVLGEQTGDLPVPAPDQPALLSWTSGTTGSPKAFLLTLATLRPTSRLCCNWRPTDGTGPAIWGLSIAAVFSSSPAG